MSAAYGSSGPSAGLATLTLASFDCMPAHLRPTRVDATPRRTTPQQQAAWRRLATWIVDATTQIALEMRATPAATPATSATPTEPASVTQVTQAPRAARADDALDAWAAIYGADAAAGVVIGRTWRQREDDDDGDTPPPSFRA